MIEIVVLGGGGHARVVISILKKLGVYLILGYTDVSDRGSISGVSFIGEDACLPGLLGEHPGCSAVIGVGNVRPDDARRRLYEKITAYGFIFPRVISPDAVVSDDVEVGEATVVMAGAVVNAGTVVGKGVILNTNCTVDHDCRIGDFVHVAPGATLSGGVKVGDSALIGAGATVIQYRTVSPFCTVGAGATVVEDLNEPGIYLGTPARRRG